MKRDLNLGLAFIKKGDEVMETMYFARVRRTKHYGMARDSAEVHGRYEIIIDERTPSAWRVDDGWCYSGFDYIGHIENATREQALEASRQSLLRAGCSPDRNAALEKGRAEVAKRAAT